MSTYIVSVFDNCGFERFWLYTLLPFVSPTLLLPACTSCAFFIVAAAAFVTIVWYKPSSVSVLMWLCCLFYFLFGFHFLLMPCSGAPSPLVWFLLVCTASVFNIYGYDRFCSHAPLLGRFSLNAHLRDDTIYVIDIIYCYSSPTFNYGFLSSLCTVFNFIFYHQPGKERYLRYCHGHEHRQINLILYIGDKLIVVFLQVLR